MSIGSHQSSKSESVDWLTPPEWIKALGDFDLDPCIPSAGMPWRTAAIMWTPEIWCNPPYGAPKIIEPWMKRMAEHNNGIALVFARTETALTRGKKRS